MKGEGGEYLQRFHVELKVRAKSQVLATTKNRKVNVFLLLSKVWGLCN